jgi:glycerophosphoryl diester phosphodiesterase
VPASLEFFPPIIAHRGASAYAPENTMAAFTKAAQLDIKWLEFDVMLTAVGEPIVFHDDTLDRTTNGSGDVGRYPYSILRTFDAGAWFDTRFSGEQIPTLKSVLEFLQNTKMSANVEIKPLPGQDEKTAIRALAEISTYFPSSSSSILFSSFSVKALQTLRAHSAECLIGLLLHEWESDWQYISESLNCVSIHVNEEIMTREKAQEIKSMGKKLLCYTVNQPVRALELYSWGVDAVFSDAPDRILKVLNPR